MVLKSRCCQGDLGMIAHSTLFRVSPDGMLRSPFPVWTSRLQK